jgi:diguanylate cyclase (GGDEF)-like protein/PAS domain S-box-containing protein
LKLRFKRLRFQLVVAFAAVLALVWAAVGYEIYHAREQALQTARQQGDNITNVVAEHFSLFADTIDLWLKHLRGEWLAEPANFKRALATEDGFLRTNRIFDVAVIDSRGFVAYSYAATSREPVFAGNRDYFSFHKAANADQLHISPPRVGLVTGKITIHFTRPIYDRRGHFAGVILLSISPEELIRTYKTIDLGAHGFITLRHPDGKILVRSRDYEDSLRMRLPDQLTSLAEANSGHFVRQALSDGVVRLFSYRRLRAYPLIAISAQSLDVALEPYYEQRRIYLTTGAVVSLVLVLLLIATFGRIRREERADAELRENESRYRALTDLSADSYWEQDPEHRFTLIKPNLASGPIVKNQRWLGKRPWEVPNLAMADDEWRPYRERIEQRLPFRDFLMKVLNAEGKPIYISASGYPLLGSDGSFHGYRGIAKDITREKREEQLVALEHLVVRCLAEADSVSAGLRAIMQAVCETQGWECGRYFAVDRHANVLRFADAWSVPDPSIQPYIERSRALVLRPDEGIAGKVWRSSEPLWVADLRIDSRALPPHFHMEAGVRGAFCFPLKSEGETIGVLFFNSREVREPDERLLEATRVIGSQIGEFVRRKHGEEALRDHDARLAKIVGLQGRLADERLDVDQISTMMVDAAYEIIGTGAAAMQFVEEEHFVYHAATEGASHLVGVKTSLEGNFSAAVVESGKAILCGDTETDPRIDAATARRAGTRSMIGAPLQHKGRVIGVLKLMSATAHAFDEEQLHMLQVLAGIAGSAIQRARSQKDLRESEARFRSLTQLSSDVYWEQDRHYRFTSFSGSVPDGLRTRRSTALGKRRWELPYVNMIATDWESHIAQLDERKPFRDLELCRVDEAGDKTWMSVSGEPVFDEAGAFQGYRGVGRDISQRKNDEDNLRRFRAAMDMSGDMVFLVDRATMRIVDVNETVCRLLGYSREELLRMTPEQIVPSSNDELGKIYDEMIANPTAHNKLKSQYRCKDGSLVPYEATRRALRSGDKWIIVVISRDVRERLAAEKALHRSNERFNLAVRATNDVIRDWDLVNDELWWNENLTKVFDHWRTEIDATGNFWRDCIHPEDRDRVVHSINQMVSSGEEENWSGEYRFRRSDGTYAHILDRCHVVRDEEGKAIRMIGAMTDITMRKEAEERLAYLAQFDSLTGLPNRHLFRDRLMQSMAQATRLAKPMAVLFIDLDRFKLVNDTLGHGAGDHLLKEATRRLRACLRPGDSVGRFGGDEFGAVLADLGKPGDASVVAQKIIDALAQPFHLDGHETYVTASIGITLFPADGDDAGTLIMNADTAMYRAKEQGRNTYQYFTREMNERAMQRVKMEASLRRAIERSEFLLHYQPKVRLDSGEVCGFEALLRWQHPERGLVSPMEFIPVLEDTGLIVPVGEWVMREVCAQIKRWQASGLRVPPVAVNLSARQFQQKGLEESVRRLLAEAGVDPDLVQIELTESLLMKDPEAAERTLQGLKESSLRLSVDDFGTGYSSLSYLKRFPIDALKIDRTFIRDVNVDPDDAAITVAIIGLAHSLKLKVIAEGVETEGQLEFLAQHGCDEIQGYLFSLPVGADECADMLREGRKLRKTRSRVASVPASDHKALRARAGAG